MTPPMTTPDEAVRLRKQRLALSDHDAMLDAQSQCVPCKLCGGKAVITDAGTGAGYYIRCENHRTFHDSKGCLIGNRRLGGWAYNVMDWWNRLHATPPREQVAGLGREAVKIMPQDRERALETAHALLQLFAPGDAFVEALARSFADHRILALVERGEG